MTYAHRFDFILTGALPWVPLRTLDCPSLHSARAREREKCPFLITYFDIFVSCLLSSFLFFSYTPIDRWTLFCLDGQDMKIIIRWFDFFLSFFLSKSICLFLARLLRLISRSCCLLTFGPAVFWTYNWHLRIYISFISWCNRRTRFTNEQLL